MQQAAQPTDRLDGGRPARSSRARCVVSRPGRPTRANFARRQRPAHRSGRPARSGTPRPGSDCLPSHGNTMSASTSTARAASTSINSALRTPASTAHTNAHLAPASAAACNPRASASSGPTPRTSSRTTRAGSSGSACPGAATTNTGSHRCPRMPTTRSTTVDGVWEPESPAATGLVALSRPARSDAPPPNTTPASEAGLAAGPPQFTVQVSRPCNNDCKAARSDGWDSSRRSGSVTAPRRRRWAD